MNKTVKIAIIFLAFLSLIQSIAIFQGKYYDQTDSGLANFILTHTNPLAFWNYNYYGGTAILSVTPTISLLIGFQQALTGIAGYVTGAEIFYILIFLISSLGMFFLLRELVWGEKEAHTNTIIATLGSILYTFFFYPQYGPSHSLFAAFVPITLLMFLRLRNKKTIFEWFGALLTASLLLSVGSLAYLPVNLMLLGFPSLLFIMKDKDKETTFAFLLLWLFICLVNLNIILSVISVLHTGLLTQVQSNNNIGSLNSITILVYYNIQNPLTALQIYGYATEGQPIAQYANNAGLAEAVQALIASMVFISLIAVLYDTRKKRDIIIGLVITLVFSIFFYDNFAPLLGILFKYLILHSSIFLLFLRSSQPIFYYCIGFIEAVCFAYGISAIVELFNRYKLEEYAQAVILIAVMLVYIHLYYLNVIELQSAPTFSIPSYAFQTAHYINSQPNISDYNVAILPAQFPFGYYTTYYYGTNIYAYLINTSVWTGGYTSPPGPLIPSNLQLKYAKYATHLNNGTGNLSTLQKDGIKYVIVENDAVPQVNYTSFNLSAIYYQLNNSSNTRLIYKTSNTTIYEVLNATPLISTSKGAVDYTIINNIIKISNPPRAPYTIYLRQNYDTGWRAYQYQPDTYTAPFNNNNLTAFNITLNGTVEIFPPSILIDINAFAAGTVFLILILATAIMIYVIKFSKA